MTGSEHCRVCGSRNVLVDEVVERVALLLVQCGRCDARWTARCAPVASGARASLGARRRLGDRAEVANAA